MVNQANPLFKHFRQPQLHISLPSEGKWYPPGALEMPVTKQVPVYAMTAKDELTLKTPDALINGQSTVDVIQSCIPAIKDAWQMPSVDVDAVLIAIRQATYGNEMEFTTVCPHCKRKNENTVDLGVLSAAIKPFDFDESIKVDGLELFLKPQTFEQFNKVSMENFEHQRLLAVVNDNSLDENEKMIRFNQLFKKLLNITVEQISKSVAAIKTEDGTLVSDKELLTEFFENCNKNIWEAVKARIEDLGNQSPLRKIDITCDHDDCNKPYVTPLVFEQSNFFG